jgi:hypothetical protein
MVMSSRGSAVQTAEYAAARERREMDASLERQVQKSVSPARRTSIGLRNALFDEIDALRRGDGNPERAIAVSKLASTIIDTVRVEIQYRKSGLSDDPTDKGMLLGSDENPKP